MASGILTSIPFKKNLVNLGILFTFFILTIPLWLKVDNVPLRIWDEAQNAVNAIEMYESHDWIVRTYKNYPETYNLKPPLLTWLQVGSFHLVGLNELAIRLPSVLAAIGTMIFVFLMVYKITESKPFALLGAGILSTSLGFYGAHVARFGDHDSLLVFFATGTIYFVQCYLAKRKTIYLYLISLFVTLGVLTKSITILMLFPGIVVFLLLGKKLLEIIKNPHFYSAILLFLFPVITYYMLREGQQPGFLNYVWNDELFPRFFNTSTNLQFADEGKSYYLKLLWNYQMHYWPWLSILLIFIPFSNLKNKNQIAFLFIVALSFLFIISLGTKNSWYDAPFIPLYSAILAIASFSLIRKLSNPLWHYVLVLAVLIIPYREAYSSAFNTNELPEKWQTNSVSHFLKDEKLAQKLTNNTLILLDNIHGYEPHLFYVKKLQIEKNIELNRVWIDKVELNDTLLVSHLETLDELAQHYTLHVIDSLIPTPKLLVLKTKITEVSTANQAE